MRFVTPIIIVLAIVAVIFFIHWEIDIHWVIDRSKKEAINAVKSIQEIPIDTVDKKIGQTLFKVKSFKNKVKEEMGRLDTAGQK